jgi:hypothetical protein
MYLTRHWAPNRYKPPLAQAIPDVQQPEQCSCISPSSSAPLPPLPGPSIPSFLFSHFSFRLAPSPSPRSNPSPVDDVPRPGATALNPTDGRLRQDTGQLRNGLPLASQSGTCNEVLLALALAQALVAHRLSLRPLRKAPPLLNLPAALRRCALHRTLPPTHPPPYRAALRCATAYSTPASRGLYQHTFYLSRPSRDPGTSQRSRPAKSTLAFPTSSTVVAPVA